MDGSARSVTGNALFHFLASLFSLDVHPANACRKDIPADEIRQLRSQGLSVAEIARRIETSPTVVRRLVGKLDPRDVAERKRLQDEAARRIDAEPLSWSEKARRWTAETGQSGATFWRVLKRCAHAESP